MAIVGDPSVTASRKGRNFTAILEKARTARGDWRQEAEAERAEAIAAALRHPALVRLRTAGDRLRSHFLAVEREEAAIRSDPNLSESGKRSRHTQVREAAERGLSRILEDAATAVAEATAERTAKRLDLSPADAARVQALLAVLPSLNPAAAIAELEAALAADDTPVLKYALPALNARAATDDQFAPVRGRLLQLTADADLRLTTPTEAAIDAVRAEAAEVWQRLTGLVTTVDGNGGRWDPLFDALQPGSAA